MSVTKAISDTNYLSMLGALRHRAEKADDLSAYGPSFVPVIDPMLLASRNTQVIFGRNGTGKTHILKCFEEIVMHAPGEHRILPIYFDMRTLDLSRIAPEVTEEQVVEAFFSTFLSESIEKLILNVEHFSQQGDQYAHFMRSPAVQSKLRAAIKRLRRAFDKSRIRERIESYTKSIRTSADSSSGIKASASASHDPSASVGAEYSNSARREEFIEMVIKASHFIEFSEIRAGISDLTSALEITHVTFLLDEWSQLDPKLQPLFAELIRRTIGTCNNVSCKIAALKFLTRFTEQIGERRIGLQPGIDITELSDLNHIFTFDLDRSSVRSFLMYILIKHLLEELLREVYHYDFDDPDRFVVAHVGNIFDRLFGHIFESREAFDYFVRASEGNPRDFLAMIAECCATHGTANLPITLKAVQASAIGYFTNSKMANFTGAGTSSLRLFNKIFERALSNKSKIFSVSKDIDIASAGIRDLWSQRVIHLIDNDYEYFDENSSKVYSYALYAVDYGKILGLRSDGAGGETLAGIVNDTRRVVSGLYDGMSHKAILEHIERENSNLARVSEILGSPLDPAAVLEQVVALTPEQLFDKIKQINVDDIVTEFGSETSRAL